MWQKYFQVVKIKPGRVDTALLGIIDLRQPNIPLEKIIKLYESDFPYLEITDLGKQEVYGATKPTPIAEKPKLPKEQTTNHQKSTVTHKSVKAKTVKPSPYKTQKPRKPRKGR